MEENLYVVESKKPFGESLIWKLNREFYQEEGIHAWSTGEVPHHLTSNSNVGKTYAHLIFGFLKDLAQKGQMSRVYFLELGAGHGRLAFHVLRHLGRLIKEIQLDLPPYCYILSDIVEENLTFFEEHPQLQTYYDSGQLDVAYFDAVAGKELSLRKSGLKILPEQLDQPIIAIGNYFFDSIPTDVFHYDHMQISTCEVSIESTEPPSGKSARELFKTSNLKIHKTVMEKPFYEEAALNEILEAYRSTLMTTHVFFPKIGIECLKNIRKFSKKGMLLLSMDKGSHELHDLENAKEPDMVSHGSISFWVNFHALGEYCKKTGGKAIFPKYSTYHLDLACLLFLPEGESYTETQFAYNLFVNEFGPEDLTLMKKFYYSHIRSLRLREIVGLLRVNGYDSQIFSNVLPRVKQVIQQITFNERKFLGQAMHEVYNTYFHINEKEDLAFEIGGIYYALGFYQEALDFFDRSVKQYGQTPDEYYNRALCHYQLRQDELFSKTLKEAKTAYPGYEQFGHLDKLDLGAK